MAVLVIALVLSAAACLWRAGWWYGVDVAILVHSWRHHGLWESLRLKRDISERGVLEITRAGPVVAYGFELPTVWTTELPCSPRYSKKDALPLNLIQLLLPSRRGCPGAARATRGTSVFLEDDKTRRKPLYLEALRTRLTRAYELAIRASFATQWHRPACRATLLTEHCTRTTADCLWRIHAGRAPSGFELAAVVSCCRAITNQVWRSSRLGSEPYFRVKERLFSSVARCCQCREAADPCMFRAWTEAGMSVDDIFAEFAHNCFGMALQWTFLLHRLVETGSRPETETDAAAFVLAALPARVACSAAEGGRRLVLHDLAASCGRARAPARFPPPSGGPEAEVVVTATGCIALPDQMPCEADGNYVPFGCGARRCPGEWLTYRFVVRASSLLPPRVPTQPTGRVARLGLNEVAEHLLLEPVLRRGPRDGDRRE